MLTDHFAKPLLDHPIELKWWCEIDKHASEFCRRAAPEATAFKDVLSTERILGAEPVDIISGGFPCQPFSSMGFKLGGQDPRGVVVWAIILYMKRALPRVAILENVPGLLTSHADFFCNVLEAIKSIKEPTTMEPAYFTMYRVLNSSEHGGVPQDRRRVYIVCIRRFGAKRLEFQWPGPIPCPPLSSIFDCSPKLDSYINYPAPKGKIAKRNLEDCLQKLRVQAEVDSRPVESYLAIVDVCASRPGPVKSVMRTITKARGYSRAFWSSARQAPECSRAPPPPRVCG